MNDITSDDNKFFYLLVTNFLYEKKILIVDDEKEVQNLMAKYLEKSNIDPNKLVFASNGIDALDKLNTEDIGLIILDLTMPFLSGKQLITKIRDDKTKDSIPIVICSGNVEADDVKLAMYHGIKDVLVKPFNYHSFIDRLSKALSS